MRGRSTRKCNCPFVIKTSTNPLGEVFIRLDDSLCVQHNHALDPDKYMHKFLPREIEDYVNWNENRCAHELAAACIGKLPGMKQLVPEIEKVYNNLEAGGLNGLAMSVVPRTAKRRRRVFMGLLNNDWDKVKDAVLDRIRAVLATSKVRHQNLGLKQQPTQEIWTSSEKRVSGRTFPVTKYVNGIKHACIRVTLQQPGNGTNTTLPTP